MDQTDQIDQTDRSDRSGLARWGIIGLIICAGCILTLTMFFTVRGWEAKRVGSELEHRADTMTIDMTRDVQNGLVTLRAIGSIYAVSEIVDRMWLRAEAERMLLSQDVICAVAWAPKVSDGGRGDHETAIRERFGYRDFEIRERDSQGRLVRAGRRAIYFPVAESFPIGGAFGEVPAGLDLTSDKALNDALQTVWKTGKLAATPPLRITPGDPRELRVVVFAPVYRSGTPDKAHRQSPQNMIGVLVGIIKVQDLIEEIVEEWDGEGIEIAVYDWSDGEQHPLVLPKGRERPARGEDPSASGSQPATQVSNVRTAFLRYGEAPLALGLLKSDGLRSTTTVEVADRHWRLEFVATDRYLATVKVWAGWEVLVMGLVFTTALVGYISMKMREGAEVERLVSIRTTELHQANRQLTSEVRERARAEEAARESEARFRVMADTAPVMIWMTGPNGRDTFYNKTLLTFTGRSREEELADWIAGVHPGDRPLLKYYWKAFSGREPFEIEYRQRRADGAYRWTLDRGTPRFLSDGVFAGYIGCGIDVTELKEAQQALRQAHGAALEASRLKSEFLANVSHEIRTPMNGILGMTDLALRTALSAEQREYLTLAKSSGESLLQIINDILDFSKIEAGHLDLERAPFLLRESVGAAIKPLALRAHSKGLELSCHVASEVPEALIGDSLRLRQIVVNLIANAIKFTERGEIVLRITLAREDPTGAPAENNGATGCRLHCTVSDTGIGIPPEKQHLIFQPFAQADGSTTRQYGGTGLGLTICARLVELMDGRVWVESEPGRGSAFHFTVHFELQDHDVAPVMGSALTLETLAGLSVLAVDDNAVSRAILEEWLTAWQMQPTSAVSGREALENLRRAQETRRSIDLCILDAEMPDLDGFSLAAEIIEQCREKIPTILMLNSIDQPRDIARCRDLGIAAYVVKPITPSELWNAMMTALGKDGLETLAAERPEHGTNGHGARISTTYGRRYRILLAEDNPINQMLAVRLLEKEGHSVLVVGNGRQALAALEQGPFDLVLMDVQMPEMDGFEATAAIREQEHATTRHLPIIALTAHAMKGDRERCLAAGMDDYLAKPLRAEALFETITRLLTEPADAAIPESVSHSSLLTPHSSPSMPESPFDKEELLERVGRDADLMREIVGLFLEEGPIRIAEIRAAVERGDAPALTKAAHTLKGAVSVFGAKKSVEMALRLEQLGRAGDLGQTGEGLRALEAAMADLLPALETMMGEA